MVSSCRQWAKGLVAALIFWTACGTPAMAAEEPAADAPLTKLTFITAWLPQAQFAGFYAAQEKGIYENYGLAVEILHGGPNRSPYDFLISGQADAAILWLATGIEKRAKGVRVVHLSQIVQESALMLIAKKTSGIKSPRDIDGRKVGLWDDPYQIQPRALFDKFSVTPRVIPQGYSINLLLRGGVDVASAMWYNEYHSILNAGYDPEELTPFFFSDYGLSFPEDGLYALEESFRLDPERFKAFAAASLEGWRYAFNSTFAVFDKVQPCMFTKTMGFEIF
jgi:NitT/TauT family transport system substrate-binding protein